MLLIFCCYSNRVFKRRDTQRETNLLTLLTIIPSLPTPLFPPLTHGGRPTPFIPAFYGCGGRMNEGDIPVFGGGGWGWGGERGELPQSLPPRLPPEDEGM